jgi:hypothetical protein
MHICTPAHSQGSEEETKEDDSMGEAGQEDTARAESTAVASAVAAASSDASGDEGYRTAEEEEKNGAEAIASEELVEPDAVLAAELALEQVRERERTPTDWGSRLVVTGAALFRSRPTAAPHAHAGACTRATGRRRRLLCCGAEISLLVFLSLCYAATPANSVSFTCPC